MVWIWHWLPFRPSGSVYAQFDNDTLPPIDSGEFGRYHTVEDIRRDPPFIGPHPLFFCDWCFDEPDMFLSDPAFDIEWSVGGNGEVVISLLYGRLVVAPTLAEFLARMKIENGIWWSVVDGGLGDLASDQGADPRYVWNMLQRVLSGDQLSYLRPYYEKRCAENVIQ